MKPDQKPDLDWQAYRYVADEMTAVEAAEFEDRLATDQLAREAVADAVGLAHAIALAGRDVTVAAPSRPPSAWRLGVAAAIAAAVLLALALPPMMRTTPTAVSPSNDAMVLAQAWTDVRENSEPLAGNLDGLVVLDDWDTDWELLVDEAEDAAPPLPTWLLTATANRSPERQPQ